jgi:flagellar hook-associated protein 3 FlgL
MRISTQMMYQQNMRGITNNQAQWMKYGEQMYSGRRVINPSDDPVAASQAVVLSQSQAQNSQYALARTFATQRVSLEESILDRVTSAIQSAQGKIVNAGNGALSDDDRAALATDLQGIRDQLMNLANSTDGNGRYVFAGYKTGSAPFDQADGTYNGGSENITQQVDASRSMVVGHTGDAHFLTPSPATPCRSRTAAVRKPTCSPCWTAPLEALKKPVAGDEAAKSGCGGGD